MQTVEIPHEYWEVFLKDFSRVNLGRQVRMWVTGAGGSVGREALNQPLLGIDVNRSGERCERVDVMVGDSPDAHVRHEVRSPSAVWVVRDDGGADVSVQIDADDGSSTYLNLASPAGRTTPQAFA